MKKTMGKEGEKGYSRTGKGRRRQEIGYSKIAEDSSRRQTIVGVVKADRGRKAIVGRVRTDSIRRQNHGKRTL